MNYKNEWSNNSFTLEAQMLDLEKLFFFAEGAGSPNYIDKNKLTPLGLEPSPWSITELQVDPFTAPLQRQTFVQKTLQSTKFAPELHKVLCTSGRRRGPPSPSKSHLPSPCLIPTHGSAARFFAQTNLQHES